MSSTEQVFEALSSTVRRNILAYISEAPLSAGDIAERFDMSQPAISKHLKILENANLVTKQREGQFVMYAMKSDTLSGTLASYMQQVCPNSIALKKERKR